MNCFFECYKYEVELDNQIKAVFSSDNSLINAYRAKAEKANLVANLLPQMVRFDFKINSEIIEVVTHTFSNFFFPELTHVDHSQYITEYEELYSNVLSLISSDRKICILDIGCGICDIAAFLADKNIFYSYHAVDKNQNIVFVNKHYYDLPTVVHECFDILDYSINYKVDYVFLFNVIKHIARENVKHIIRAVFAASPNATILVYDIETLEILLSNDCKREGYVCRFEKRILCITNRK